MSVLFTDEQLSKATASRQDGISQEDEEAYRAKTNEFVTALTRKLDMCVFACVRVCVWRAHNRHHKGKRPYITSHTRRRLLAYVVHAICV